MPVSTSVPASGIDARTLQNNAASWWFRDPGLRALALPVLVGWLSTVSAGYDGSLMTGLQANKRYFIPAIGTPDSNRLGIIVAAYTLGAIPALLPASYMADNFGRRISLGVGCLIVIAGGLVQTLTTGGMPMLGGRFVVGFGGAVCSISGSPYAIEIAHPRNRPQVGALVNTCWYIGSIIAAWTAFGTGFWDHEWSWRLVCLMQVFPPFFQLVCLPWCPESPRFLISKGKVDEAHRMLAKYHANGDMNDQLVLFELEEIKEAIELERNAAEGVTYMAFFRSRGNLHRFAILIMVGLFSQWVGNGIISYYLVQILDLSCERFGRRKLWLTSAIGMFFSFIVIMACSAAYADLGKHSAGPAVLAFLFIYFGFYDIAFTGLTLAYPMEILPFSLRTKGMAILQLCISLALFFNQYVNPIALTAIAWKYYAVYIVIQAFVIVCIYFFYPETKGLMLEEIAAVFDGEKALLPTQQQGEIDLDKKDSGVVSHHEVASGEDYTNARAA